MIHIMNPNWYNDVKRIQFFDFKQELVRLELYHHCDLNMQIFMRNL